MRWVSRLCGLAILAGIMAVGASAWAEDDLSPVTAELKRLQPRIGVWQLETRCKVGDETYVVHGTETCEWTLNGQYLQIRAQNDGGAPDSLFLVRYDAATPAYRGWYFDGQGGASEFLGTWVESPPGIQWVSEAMGHPKFTGNWNFESADLFTWSAKGRDGQDNVLMELTGRQTREKSQ